MVHAGLSSSKRHIRPANKAGPSWIHLRFTGAAGRYGWCSVEVSGEQVNFPGGGGRFLRGGACAVAPAPKPQIPPL
jgi:hypothetical protein